MRKLDLLELKGAVRREIRTHYRSTGQYTEERVFGRDGRLLSFACREPNGVERSWECQYGPDGELIDPRTRIIRNTDGSRIELQVIFGMDSWSMIPGLHQTGFGTMGASVAKTSFNRDGIPIATVFEDSGGEELSAVLYAYDDRGNIVKAVQYGGSQLWAEAKAFTALADAAQVEALRKFLEPGSEHFRVTFRYDDADRVIEEERYFAGQLMHHIVKTYNVQGDVLTWTVDTQVPVRVEYDYDQRQNWIRKTVYHSGGRDEYSRAITYFDD